MLSSEDQNLIQTHTAGMVATVNDDGTPAVSPKATFVVIDASTIAFGNLRSPNTLANLRQRPQVEVCFIDVIRRRAVRVRGRASVHKRSEAPTRIATQFEANWPDLCEHMSHYVEIAVSNATQIDSPAYDHGATEAALISANLTKLNDIYGAED